MLRALCAGFAVIVGYCAWQWITFLMEHGTETINVINP